MSLDQLPPASSGYVTNQARYNTYIKANVLDDWPDFPSDRFICNSIGQGRGLTFSTASFTYLAEDQTDTQGKQNMTPEFAQSSGLVLGDDLIFSTQFVLVTEDTENGEVTRFLGTFTDVSYSVKTNAQGDKYASIDSYTAMGPDWMLSQIALIGGYVLGITDNGAEEVRHTCKILPVLNPEGQGNMSLSEYSPDGGTSIKVFDFSNVDFTEQDEDFSEVRWTVSLFANYALYQMENNIPQDDNINDLDVYRFYREFFGGQTELDFDAGADVNLEDSTSSIMNNVEINTTSVWELLVSLVEGSGESSLTIKYQDNYGASSREARITVIN